MKTTTIFLTSMMLFYRSMNALRLPLARTCPSSSAHQPHTSPVATSTWIRHRKHVRTYNLYVTTEKTSSADSNTDSVEESIFDIDLPSNENNEDLLKIRHSTAHVMAMAVQQVHPDAKVTIGPWIDNG